MRVYEFSKEHNISNKEILAILNKAGFSIKSHMSLLTPETIDFLNKSIKQSSKKESTQEKKIEVEAPVSTKKSKESIAPSMVNKDSMETVNPIHKIKSVNSVPQKIISSSTENTAEKELIVTLEPTVLADLASKINKPVTELIVALLKWGILSNKNQVLSEDIVGKIAAHYQIDTKNPVQKKEEIKKEFVVDQKNLRKRLPVVVVLGHVDHGKTTLLDYIRNARVASREKGGITQHLGAYEAQTKQGNLIFLDTPGHEAFSKMRARGVKVADIAILVVAADDSIMPQTIEAIKHAKAIDIPIIVAINKVDKANAVQIEKVRRDLAQYDLLPEEWGGTIPCALISAKLGTGIDQLLEMIALQAEIMELQADLSREARGYVLEAKIEKGRGSVATLLLQHGTLSVGDYFICGSTGGKINSIVDSYGKHQKKVGPSIPVQVAGFDDLPQVGDFFEVVSKNEFRKAKSVAHEIRMTSPRALALQGALNILVKTDTNSSKEALLEAITKLSLKNEKGFNVIHSGIGSINESDIILAMDTHSKIFGLHVKAEPNAMVLAQKESTSIHLFDIIYKLLEHLQEQAEAAKEVKMITKKTGEAVVRRVFDIKNIGVIAGCYVREGTFHKNGTVVVWRGKQKIGEGPITSLQRDKKTVKEVHAGFECAFMIENLNDWQEDDRVECFIKVPEQAKATKK